MSYIMEHLWPIPLYADICDNTDQIQKELDAVFPSIEFEPAPARWGRTHKLTDQTFTQDFLRHYNLKVLTDTIHHHLTNYCNELEFRMVDYQMQSWMTLNEPGSFARVHNHGVADISGCYYYRTNGEDGDIYFEPPTPFFTNSPCFYNKYRKSWQHSPKVGKIIIFPGWLDHGVWENNTDQNRYSVAFNITFRR
jgi:uncharacterized protein (TIGR02466 family)